MVGTRLKRTRAASLVLACAALAMTSTTASADGAIIPFFENTFAPVPSDGALLLNDWLRTPIHVTVTPAGSTTRIPGKVSWLFGNWIWKPDAPMAQGQYWAMPNETGMRGSILDQLVTVIEPLGSIRPELHNQFEPTLSFLDDQEDARCCTDWNGAGLARLGDCYLARRFDSYGLAVSLESFEPASVTGQFLFEVVKRGSGPPEVFGAFYATLQFDEPMQEYCFDVYALNIGSGEVWKYDELPSSCVPHGDLPELGPAEVFEPSFRREACKVPPTGFEAPWCEQHEAACEAAPSSEGCELAGYVCRGEPLPSPVDSDAGVAADASMPEPDRDAQSALPDASADAAMPSVPPANASGCTCSIGPRRARLELSALLVLAAIAALCRARPRRR
jgi:hypothetical protein